MCGIAGIINLNKESVSKTILNSMTDALAHRGPDGRGVYVDRFIGLGHRRLSIIDLSEKASQPMQTEDGNFVISPNPAKSYINIESLKPNLVIDELILVNTSGEIVKRMKTQSIENQIMKVGNLKSGVYLLMINTLEGSYIEKVIIK